MSDYYRLDRILKEQADFNLIVGERGNGKTYAMQEYLLKERLINGGQCVWLRRWMDDVKASNAQNFWDGLLVAQIEKLSGGRYQGIELKASRYYLCSYDQKGKAIYNDNDILGYVTDVNEAERLKGQSFPRVTNIVYEEFISLSQMGYIPDETVLFDNIISTIVRDRTNVKIWMLGNTINPYNPYFIKYGIRGLNLKQGDIWTRTNGYGGKLAVEFCPKRRKGSMVGTSAKYFGFEDSSGNTDMILGNGWQLPDVPTLPYPSRDVLKLRIPIIFDMKVIEMSLFYNSKHHAHFIWVRLATDDDLDNPIQFVNKRYGKKCYVLYNIPQMANNFYTAISKLPIESSSLLQKLKDCFIHEKIWYEDKWTASYFNNFIGITEKTKWA